MYHQRTIQAKEAFTLIELLIVILIVSLVYYFGFSGFEFNKPKPKALTPLNLKSTLQSSEWFDGHMTLLCVEKCKTCYFRRNIRANFRPYKNAIDLTGVIPYTIDERNNLQEIEYGRYDDKQICLVMDFYNNGSSTQIILKQGDNAYFLPAFFGKAKRFDSIEDAKEYWLRYTDLLSDKGNYY